MFTSSALMKSLLSATGEDMNPWQNSSAVDGNITDHKPSSADDGGNSSFPTPAASDALRSKGLEQH